MESFYKQKDNWHHKIAMYGLKEIFVNHVSNRGVYIKN